VNPSEALGFSKPEPFDQLKIRSRFVLWRYWWSYTDEVRALKGDQFILAALRTVKTNDTYSAIQNVLETNIAMLLIPTNEENDVWISDPAKADLHFVMSRTIPSSFHTFQRVIKGEIARRIVTTAIALKRYQLKHNNYPPDLEALMPEFLAAIPRDLDGKPLRYQWLADGTFSLYSIGGDGRDNGGDPTPATSAQLHQWPAGRDWVWPQTATAAEIRNYYNNPPK
jgi:hypothetical protein